MLEILVFANRSVRVGVLSGRKRARTGNGIAEFVVVDSLVSIYIKTTHNRDDFAFSCVVAVESAELLDAFKTDIVASGAAQGVKRAAVSPVKSTTHVLADTIELLVELDFLRKQLGQLGLNAHRKTLVRWAVLTGSLGDHRPHIEVVAREEHLHKPRRLNRALTLCS